MRTPPPTSASDIDTSDDAFRMQVALKILTRGTDTAAALGRFRAEHTRGSFALRTLPDATIWKSSLAASLPLVLIALLIVKLVLVLR